MAFAGGHHDSDVAADVYGQRWLDVATNTWLSQDPVSGTPDSPMS
jgi:hypothetical protein